MKRREILRYTAYITGAAVGAPIAASLLAGCKPNAVTDEVTSMVSAFSDNQMSFISKIVDVILPKTDSPSASDVGVHTMIDHMVSNVYNSDDRKNHLSKLNILMTHVGSDSDLLASLKSLESSSDASIKAVKDAYLGLKQQTVAYYLSSEEIGKNYLNYLPVPGAYEACIALDDVDGKAWAI